MEFSIGLKELLIGVVLASLVYLLEVLVLGRREGKVRADPALREEIAALRQSLRQLGERVTALEVQVLGESLSETSDRAGMPTEVRLTLNEAAASPPRRVTPQAPAPESPSVHYDRPLHYAREGLPAAEIAARCGISRAEAELLVALHGPRSAAR